MRRTLFVFPRDLLPAAWGSASARVAEAERKRIGGNAVTAGLADDGDAWLAARRREVLDLLASAGPLGAQQLRERLPDARRQGRRLARLQVGRRDPDRPAGPRLARRPGRDRARRQRRPLADLPAALDPDGRLAGGGAAARCPRPTATASWSAAGWPGSGPARRPTWSGGSARPRPPYAVRWPTSARSRSRSTPATPAGCCPTTSTRRSRPTRRPRCCRPSTRRPWAGSSATSTSPPTTSATSSTPSATPAPPPGGAAGSSAAGCRTTTGRVHVVLRGDPGARARRALDDEAERLTAWLGGEVVGNVYTSRADEGRPAAVTGERTPRCRFVRCTNLSVPGEWLPD